MKVIDFTAKKLENEKKERRRQLVINHKKGTATGAMPDENIRSVKESMERINAIMNYLRNI